MYDIASFYMCSDIESLVHTDAYILFRYNIHIMFGI